jgi:hypothetical protein
VRKRLLWQWIILWLLIVISQSLASRSLESRLQEAKRIHELDTLVKTNPNKAVSESVAILEKGGPPTLAIVAASHLGDLGSPEGISVLEALSNKQQVIAKLRVVAQVSLERIRLGLAQKSPDEKKEVFQAMLKDPRWNKSYGEILRVAGNLIELDAYPPRAQNWSIAHYRRFQNSIQGIKSAKKRRDVLINRLQDFTNLKPAESIAICMLLIEEGSEVVPPLLSLLDNTTDKRSVLVNDIADILTTIGDARALSPLKALASSPDPSISHKVAGHVLWLESGVPYPYKYRVFYGWDVAGY